MAGRKAVVAAGNDMIQLVQWIAARTPSLAFLIGDKQVAPAIERERVRDADAGGDGLKPLRRDRPLLNRAALTRQIVMRNAVLDAIRIGIIRRQQPEIQIPRDRKSTRLNSSHT